MQGRRAILALVVVSCAGGGLGSRLVVVAEVQSLVEWLRERVTRIGDAVGGKDKGVDARVRACVTSIEVVEFAVRRAPKLEHDEVLGLLERFLAAYGELVDELDAEGFRRSGLVTDDAGAHHSAPTRAELERTIRERLGDARSQG